MNLKHRRWRRISACVKQTLLFLNANISNLDLLLGGLEVMWNSNNEPSFHTCWDKQLFMAFDLQLEEEP